MNFWLPAGKDWEKGWLGSLDPRVHTAVSEMDSQQGPPAQQRRLFSVQRGDLGWRGI